MSGEDEKVDNNASVKHALVKLYTGRARSRRRQQKMPRLLATLGLASLAVVVLTHVAEHWQLFPDGLGTAE